LQVCFINSCDRAEPGKRQFIQPFNGSFAKFFQCGVKLIFCDLSAHKPPHPFDQIEVRAVCGQENLFYAIPAGIFLSRRFDSALSAGRDTSVSRIGTPVQICGIEENRSGRFWRNGQIGIFGIMAGQRAFKGFFFNVSVRSRLTIYKGSEEVTSGFPQFHFSPNFFRVRDIAGWLTAIP